MEMYFALILSEASSTQACAKKYSFLCLPEKEYADLRARIMRENEILAYRANIPGESLDKVKSLCALIIKNLDKGKKDKNAQKQLDSMFTL